MKPNNLLLNEYYTKKYKLPSIETTLERNRVLLEEELGQSISPDDAKIIFRLFERALEKTLENMESRYNS